MFGSPEFSWIVMDVVKSEPEVRLWPTWDGPTLMFLCLTDERRRNLQEREMRNEKNSINNLECFHGNAMGIND